MEGRLVLVVDDSSTIRNMVGAALKEEGCQVEYAEDGLSALGYVNKAAAPPDAIVLDVEMPRMNGYEVCRILKGDPVHRNIPIVMLTALDEESDKEWGLDVGADAYLTKPVDFSELMKTLTGVFTGAARGR